MLHKKRILFISVKFFNYENLIKEQLENMGAEVDMYDERPSNSFFSKAIIRIKKEAYNSQINRHFRAIIENIKNSVYDYFLLIKGEATPKFFLDFLREKNPNITFIYYTYDSFRNNPNGLKILDLFDSKFTFDSNDAKNYQIRFRPLFYAKNYEAVSQSNEKIMYDLAFIGTAHSDRYFISESARKWCLESGFKMFTFYFSPSKILFNYRKLTDRNFRNFDIKNISFASLTHLEIIEIYKKSKIILDINHPGQNGLTMRTFETLGAGRKLITTNQNIRLYPFFNPQNIYIIERNNIVLDELFFKTDFENLPAEILNSMSIKGWVEEVFGMMPKNDVWGKVVN